MIFSVTAKRKDDSLNIYCFNLDSALIWQVLSSESICHKLVCMFPPTVSFNEATKLYSLLHLLAIKCIKFAYPHAAISIIMRTFDFHDLKISVLIIL